jgi:hypothetical protein
VKSTYLGMVSSHRTFVPHFLARGVLTVVLEDKLWEEGTVLDVRSARGGRGVSALSVATL